MGGGWVPGYVHFNHASQLFGKLFNCIFRRWFANVVILFFFRTYPWPVHLGRQIGIGCTLGTLSCRNKHIIVYVPFACFPSVSFVSSQLKARIRLDYSYEALASRGFEILD